MEPKPARSFEYLYRLDSLIGIVGWLMNSGFIGYLGSHWELLYGQGWAALIIVSLVAGAFITLAVAAAIWAASKLFGNNKKQKVARFYLSLHFKGDDPNADMVREENLYRYYCLLNRTHLIGADGQPFQLLHMNLFIMFADPVVGASFRVRFANGKIGGYEIKDSSPMHLIISFTEPVANQVVEIESYRANG